MLYPYSLLKGSLAHLGWLLLPLVLLALPRLAQAGPPTLTLQGTVAAGNGVDVTAFVDQIELVNANTGLVTNVPANAGFETTGSLAAGNGVFAYAPTGTGWSFNATAGIAANNSAFGSPTAPEGTHVGLLQTNGSVGSMSQLLASVPAGMYSLRLRLAQRNSGAANQGVVVRLDNVVVGTFTPPNDGQFTTYTTGLFALNAVLRFEGKGSASSPGADVTAFVDNLQLLSTTNATVPALTNAGFETTGSLAAGNGVFAYAPTGTGWSFGSSAGIASNGSGFGNPDAYDGTHVAFIQRSGSGSQFEQTIPVLLANHSYAIGWLAAQRATSPSDQAVSVVVNGAVIDTYTPPVATGSTRYVARNSSFYLAFPSVSSVSPIVGPVGTSVTLSGDALANPARITVNGTDVPLGSITAISRYGITFPIPAGATTGLITVTTLSGASFTYSEPFVVGARLNVLATTPAGNQRAASPTTAIGLRFDQAPSVATGANARVFSAQYQGRRAFTVAAGATNSLALSLSGAPFRAGELVSVSVPRTVLSTAGGAAVPYGFQFTTATDPQAGSGRFLGSASLSLPAGDRAVALGDVDGDGDLDLVVGNGSLYSSTASTGALAVRLNDGRGTFGPGSDVPVTGTGTGYVALADFDADGDLDLVALSNGTLSVRFNNGNGTFSSSSARDMVVSTGYYSTAVGDIDNDGDLDVLVPDSYSGNVYPLLNNGSGVLSQGATILVVNSPNANAQFTYIALGDVDGDGDLDLLGTQQGTVRVRLNNGDGTFSTSRDFTVPSAPTGVALGDVDGDNDLDVFLAGPNIVRLNDGSGTFLNVAGVGLSNAITAAANPVLADVDGDGDLDLLSPNAPSALSVRLNDGNGVFSGTTEVDLGVAARFLATGDLDGDGDLDFVGGATNTSTSGTTGNTLAVRFNQAPVPVISGFSPTTAAIGASVTISGTGLAGVTSLTLNGAAVPLTAITGNTFTALTFTVPAGATSGPITLVNPGGTATTAQPLTVAGYPVLTSLSSTMGQAGTVLTLSGTYLGGTTAITFAGLGGLKVVSSGFVVNAAGTQITGVVVPAGVQSGNVTVTNTTGTSAGRLLTVPRLLATGYHHTQQIRADGTLWAWGRNDRGQLGIGTTANSPTPVQVGTATTWASVAAGYYSTVAVRTDGTLWAWGRNDSGQLGTGSAGADALTPVQVGSATNWVSASVGGAGYVVAIRADGTLWSWGGGLSGTTTPAPVGTATTWVSAAASEYHLLAVRADGTLWAWGNNNYGQLGSSTSGSSLAQVGTDTNWLSVSAAGFYSLALRTDGTLWAWGRNNAGQLGNGTTTDTSVPTQVGTAANWTSVAAGEEFAAALRADGTLWSWGNNSNGQLGNGTTTGSSTPTQVGPASSWVRLATGRFFAVAEQSCRSVWAWGSSYYGEVGDGTTTSRLSPVQVYNGAALLSFSPAGAAPGASVAVTGRGLAGLTALTVNGASVPLPNLTNLTDTGFSFVVPGGATATGTTTVATGCGTASSSAFIALPCVTPVLQSASLTLAATGTGSVAASAFDAGSTSSCGAITPTIRKVGAGSGVVYGDAAQGTSLTLTAPTGTVFASVEFASYGTATGTNGTYTLGSCDAPGSLAIVRSLLVGRTGTVIIPASNTTFGGDPCPSATKHLLVRATYLPATPAATPTLTYTCAEVGTQEVVLTLTDAYNLSVTQRVSLTVTAPPVATLTGLSPQSAAPGTTVTVTGTNLSGATALTVNGAAAALGNLTATSFTFVVPAGAAATGNLVLSLPCAQTITRAFQQLPAITSFTPTSGVAGTSVSLAGTSLTGTTAVTFTGTSGNVVSTGFTVNAAGTQITGIVVPTGATTGPLTVTAPQGASAASSQAFLVRPVITSFSPPSGVVGTSVTLAGTNLGSATGLTLNGIDVPLANITANTATSLTFTVPAGVSSGTLVVATSSGSSAASSALFYVLPGVASFTPTSGPVGTSLSLTGTNLKGTTAVTFTGTSGNVVSTGFAVDATGTQLTGIVVPAGAQTGPLTVTTPSGTGPASSQSFTVCRLTPLVQNLTLPLGPDGTASLAASAFDNGSTSSCGGPVTLVARKGGVVFGSVPENGTLQLTAPAGTRFVSVDFVSYGNATGTNGSYTLGTCNSPNSRSVVETALLGKTGTVSIPASNTAFGGDPCSGVAKSLVVRAAYTVPGTEATTLAYTCAEVGPQPVLLTLTDANGSSTILSATVTVVAPPTATLTGLSPQSATSGTTVTASGTNLAGATTLTVNGATATIGNLTATGFTFVVPATATPTGNLVLSLPCAQTLTKSFQVLPAIASLTPTSGPVGTSLSLTGTGLTGTTAIAFTGTSGNVVSTGFTVNAAGTQITGIVVPTGAQTGPLTVTTPGGPSAASSQSFAVCRVVAAVQNLALQLNPNGTASLAASAFDNGSSASCGGPVTVTARKGGVAYGRVSENAMLTLTAPAGYVFAGVEFASFGNATGTTGSYTLGTCNSPNSRSVVEAALLGKTGTVNIVASNATFGGDPCSGVAKFLAVRAIYVPTGGAASATLAYGCAEVGAQPVALTLTDANGASTTANATVTITAQPAATLTGLNPQLAAPGTTVTATGTNLSGATALTVSGAPVAIDNLTATGFTFVVPASAAGTSSVVLTLPCAQTLTQTLDTGRPLITACSPPSGVAGTSVTLTGTNLAGASALTVNDITLTPAAVTATSLTFVVPAGASNSQLITVTTPGGTSPTSTAFRVQLRVLSTSPVANAHTVAAAGTALNLTFSERVAAATLAPTATTGLRVYSAQAGGRKGGTVTVSGTSATYSSTLTGPLADFRPGEVISVTAPASVQGRGGLAATPKVYQFTTATGGTGRGGFAPSSAVGVGARAIDVAVGDVDGDGDLDQVTVSNIGNSVSVRLNGGDATGSNTGVFAGGSNVSMGTYNNPTSLVLGDVDGDGDLDLLTSNYNNLVSVRLNGGDASGSNTGVFSNGSDLLSVTNNSDAVADLALGDVDGDGDLDLVLGVGATVAVRLNGGDATGSNTGVFAGGSNVGMGTYNNPSSIALGDVDGDGDLDFLAAAYTGSVAVRLNGGDATGSNTGVFSNGSDVGVGNNPFAVSLADVDGDGDLDMVTAKRNSSVSVRLNGGDATGSNTGTFAGGSDVPVDTNPNSLVLGDVDGDGDLDLLTSNYNNSVSVRLNGGDASGSGTGTFSGGSDVALGFRAANLALGDVDGDGDLDLTIPDYDNSSVSVRLNQPLPTISSFSPTSGPPGTILTIVGTALNGLSAVTFTGTSGNVVSTGFTVNAAGTQITGIIVPAGAQTGPLTVTTPSGTGPASSQSFTVCRVTPLVQNLTLPLASDGTGSIAAGAFDNGSTANCGGPVTVTARKGTLVYGVANENGSLQLTAPAGTQFTSVVFASFGNATGSAGNYTLGSCNSSGSRSVVETALLGRTGSISIAATNATFGGDPCNGTAKKLTVAAIYTSIGLTPSAPATTLAYTCAEIGTQPVVLALADGNGASTLTAATVTVTAPPAAALTSLPPQPATRGTTVSVTGTNLGGATGLTVNGASATISTLTATGFSFVVPNTATASGNLSLSLPCGQTLTQPFSTVAPAVPTLTVVVPAAELPGLPVTLTGTGFDTGSTVSFGGVAATSVTYVSATVLTAVVPAGAPAGPVAVVVTNASGSSASSPAFEVLALYDAATTNCPSTQPYATTGDGAWHYLRAANGQVVAALQDTNPALGTVSMEFQVLGTANPVRRDNQNRPYLDRNFHVLASGGSTFPGQTVNLRFFGLTTEMDRLKAAEPNASYAGLKALQYSGSNEDCDPGNDDFTTGEVRLLPAPASTPANGPGWFVASVAVADHFSEFYLTSTGTPLPVQLTAFTAAPVGATAVRLDWTTASELNSQAFEVERSRDGIVFARIGQVAAAGNTNTLHRYQLLDARLPTAAMLLYYRLRQVDQDGTFSYSPVRTVALTSAAAGLALFPNPTHGAATLTGAQPGAAVTVHDALGRDITKSTADAAGTAALQLPPGLAPGVYVVRTGSQALRLTVE